MQRYFGPQGILASKVNGFEYRASQEQMAEAVAECLTAEAPLLVEAGTGTGKTWAYLIPAILGGKRVVVSTGTKTLQDQILDHDIPFLKKTLSPHLRVTCLKGRRNYLCRRRFRQFSYQPNFYNKDEARLFKRFQQWAVRSVSGDRAEAHWLPDHFQAWSEVCCDSDTCLGQHCEDHGRCHLMRLRAEAAQAHLLVVNHHLFFADLALRKKGMGEVLPDYDAVIFDEAHQLEDVLGLYFGFGFSSGQLKDLMRDILKECGGKASGSKRSREIRRAVESLDPLQRLLHVDLSQGGQQGRFALDRLKPESGFWDHCSGISHALHRLEELLTPNGDSPPAFETLLRRAAAARLAVDGMTSREDASFVYWYEISPKFFSLNATPVSVEHILGETLLSRKSALVFTSATLAVAGSFDFFKNALGLPKESRELVLPSPFSYEEQARLYIPRSFPQPQDREFCRSLAEQAVKVLAMTRGRALMLFTSYRHMREVHALLAGRLPYPVLMQGERTKRALIAEFKEKVDSVLLATSSFWQGVDVPGEALSCLLIDKLPFEAPDDPIVAARMQHLTDSGKSSFFQYQVPRAVIQLKQGVGRLIRCSTDGGVIAIFDVRIHQKGYGAVFLRSLPPFPVVRDLDEVDAFLAARLESRKT